MRKRDILSAAKLGFKIGIYKQCSERRGLGLPGFMIAATAVDPLVFVKFSLIKIGVKILCKIIYR